MPIRSQYVKSQYAKNDRHTQTVLAWNLTSTSSRVEKSRREDLLKSTEVQGWNVPGKDEMARPCSPPTETNSCMLGRISRIIAMIMTRMSSQCYMILISGNIRALCKKWP